MTESAAHAHSFGRVADRYERGRPAYPRAALDWLLPPGRPSVLDLGAGTGKLTREVHRRGLTVVAVDPSAAMLAHLRRGEPGVPALVGDAEHIPLAAASVDVVLVAQAWHWMDPARAVPEVARVLASGGRLGLVWNLRDETRDWVRRLGEIIGAEDRDRPTGVGAPFGPVETRSFRWTHTTGREQLVDLVASRSEVILLPADEKAAVLGEVRKLIDTHPELVGRTDLAMPYITFCARTTLPA